MSAQLRRDIGAVLMANLLIGRENPETQAIAIGTGAPFTGAGPSWAVVPRQKRADGQRWIKFHFSVLENAPADVI